MIDFAIMQQQVMENAEMLKEINRKLSQMTNTHEYMTMDEAVKYTKLSDSTLRRHKNQIGCSQRDRKIIFNKTNLDKWLEKYLTT